MMKVKGRVFISWVLICCILFSFQGIASRAQGAAISLEKNVFKQGEAVTVSYTGTSDKDWIGIFVKGAVPGGDEISIVYDYTSKTGQPDGVMDFSNPERGDITQLPVGGYDMYLLKNDGYEVLDKVSFNIVGEHSVIMNKDVYVQGEDMELAYTGSTHHDSWVAVYRATELPGTGPVSLIWQYTRLLNQPDGSTNLKNLDGDFEPEELIPGKYIAYLFGDGGYNNILAQYPFTVEEAPSSGEAPSAVEYNRSAGKNGYADGTVSITAPNDPSGLTGYNLYWGNEDGIFTDYTEIPVSIDKEYSVNHKLYENTMIPYGATRLYAYAQYSTKQSEQAVWADLPQGIAAHQEAALYKFQVFSDTHITVHEPDTHYTNLVKALNDIKETAPDSIAIFNVGDVTDTGNPEEYVKYNKIINSADGIPYIYCSPGNHDLSGNGDWREQIDRFLQGTNAPQSYYAQEIDGNMFILLGSQTRNSFEQEYHFANIFEDQQKFLREKLEEGSKGTKPVFVFLHQPLYNTTAGSLPGQGWHGVEQDAEIRAILKDYPNAILFTGHTHWELDSLNNMFAGNGIDATMFNDASVGYLWTDDQRHKDGSQGYYLEVYADKVLVRGRDFTTGQWVTNAQFIVDITLNIIGLTDQIPENDEGLISFKEKIINLLTDLNSLSEERQKDYTKQSVKLTALKERIIILEEQIQALERLIEQLPIPEEINLSHSQQIMDAVEQFSKFTEEQVQIFSSEKADKLQRLVEALGNLPKDEKADTAELEKQIAAAKSISLDNYTKETAKTLENALEKALQVLAAELSKEQQKTVDDASGELQKAINGLLEKADTTELQKQIIIARNINLSEYTEQTAVVLETALAKAIEVWASDLPKAQQIEIDNMTAELLKAIEDLEKIPDDTDDTNDTEDISDADDINDTEDASNTKDQTTSPSGSTKTKPNDPSGKNSPKTGDQTAIVLLTLLAVSGLLITCKLSLKLRKK